MHRAGRGKAWIEFDLAEGAFVANYVLLQKSEQGFGLLRAEVNALKVANFHLGFGLLLQSSEDEEEVPDIHAHLHAVGIGLAIIRRIGQLNIRWYREAHARQCNQLAPGREDVKEGIVNFAKE